MFHTNRLFHGLSIGLILFFYSAALLSAQTTTQKPEPLNYAKRMEKSAREIHWGRTYYQSYQKTKEYRYLKLSFNYCADAVKSYYATQKRITQTNKFSFEVKTVRLETCAFCLMLSEQSRHLSEKKYIQPVNSRYCAEDLH